MANKVLTNRQKFSLWFLFTMIVVGGLLSMHFTNDFINLGIMIIGFYSIAQTVKFLYLYYFAKDRSQ